MDNPKPTTPAKPVQRFLDAYEIRCRQVGCHTKSIVPVLHRLSQRVGAHTKITSQDVDALVADMQREGYKSATILVHLSYLRAALRYAQKRGEVDTLPYFPTLKFHNARQGFFEREEFEAILAHLPEPHAAVARFGYSTGWRLSEILTLHWSQVDLQRRTVTLPRTKNGHGRILPLTTGLADVFKRARQWGISERVFHVRGNSISREHYWQVWKAAREAARLPEKLFHDFRRTAARDMIAAGLDYGTAMQVTGHRTMSMFLRYQISDLRSLRRGLDALEAHRAAA